MEDAGDDTYDEKDEAVGVLEFEEEVASRNCEVSSPIDREGGKGRSMEFDRPQFINCEAWMSSIRSCSK